MILLGKVQYASQQVEMGQTFDLGLHMHHISLVRIWIRGTFCQTDILTVIIVILIQGIGIN